jgi:hypothetical protein
MALTSVDPPELLRFVKKHYPDAVLHRPEMSIYDLIRKKNMLPQRRARFCCQILKEQQGKGTVTALGIRAHESYQRSQRSEFTAGYKVIGVDQFNNTAEQMVTCVGGADKILLSPILQ